VVYEILKATKAYFIESILRMQENININHLKSTKVGKNIGMLSSQTNFQSLK